MSAAALAAAGPTALAHGPGPLADVPGPLAYGLAPLAHGHGGSGVGEVVAVLGLLTVLVLYLLGAAAAGRRGGRWWSRRRTVSFCAGVLLLAVAVSPPLAGYAHHDFRGHMLQHLLIGMLAPLGLVLGAPVTLAMRALGPGPARAIGRVLRSRPVHLIANPFTALALNIGGLYALYATPLYGVSVASPVAHELVHAHFLAAGCLFAWVIAGPDPAPRRPSVPLRLVVLGVAITAHAVLAQLMYAGLLRHLAVPPDQLRGGAELMYYGGDIAELLLAFALVSTWRRRRSPSAPSASSSPPSSPPLATRTA
ncbi:cytochrome c oxidase assembly protein [Bailinhaonella thermotolerans]|uniref:Cytochrome c oxidase assembly protein n=1 Tax=Bailinhaonella thermotolerans TaxID=1070861 RepID=A0A3A4B2X4_9ACTN|nr:cytochrome c oxidase assembly protein [Bailinhaonella thermotolerans]RJL32409.1 cytochrome c oxidase assembly protein [Bailinhaonella thermotolerans]